MPDNCTVQDIILPLISVLIVYGENKDKSNVGVSVIDDIVCVATAAGHSFNVNVAQVLFPARS